MPIREFIDALGVRWVVWNTMPQSVGVAGGFVRGWLTFESSAGRRRLAPIPEGWENASPERLRLYCAAAEPAGQTPHTGQRPVERRD